MTARKECGLFIEFFKELKKNRGAVLGLCLILFFSLIALFAPLIAPHSPSELFDNALRLPPIFSEYSNMFRYFLI